MAQIFLGFLLTSLVGTGLALILTLFKPITRKTFSGGWHYYMWLVVLIVMILPIRLSLPQTSEIAPTVFEPIVNTDNQNLDFDTHIVPDIEQKTIIEEQDIVTTKISVFQTVKDFVSSKLELIGFIWIIGAMLIFFIKILSYIIFLSKIHKHSEAISCSELKDFTNRKVITRVSDTICSPLIIGIFRPTLLLPKSEITMQQLHNVLAHEVTHLKRNDILYKWLVAICKCVHWFNPVIYFIGKQINIDCEISCDLAVVKNMNKQEEKSYIETILALLTHKNSKAIPLTTGMTGNKKTLKKRFTMIKNKFKMNKKATIISITLAVVLLISAIVISGLINGNIFNSLGNTAMDINTDKVVGNNFNVLFVGLDDNERADTIMLIKVQEDSIQGISIPRNTLVKDKRISDIISGQNGDQAAVDAIKQTLSVPIHYYAKLDLIAIKEIVDAVGGVDFDVPMNMVYDDPYQDLHINLKQGRHTLNGDGVCQLLQYRRGYPEGDLTRIQIGQQFMKEFIAQKLNKENIDKAPKIFKTISDNIQTNYQIGNLKRDMQIISAIKSDNISFDTVAGDLMVYSNMPVYQIDFTRLYKENGIHPIGEIFFYDTTPYEIWIEKQEDGWYNLPTKTIVASFPSVDTPISVTAYYAEVGNSVIQELAKITEPYIYHTMAKVLSIQVPFPKEDIYGELWFEFEYENGERIISEYFDVYRKAIGDPTYNESVEQRKADIIHQSLKDGEEILINSGDKWHVTEKQVKSVLDKISENRQMKPILISNGNYDVFIYSIWTNNASSPRLFIINTDSQKLILSMNLDKNLYSDVINLLNGNAQKTIGDPTNSTSVNDTKVAITDIGCDDIADSDYIYEYFTYDNNNADGRNNTTLSKKDGTISFYYKSNKKQSMGIKLVEEETGNIDAEYTITPEPDKIYTFNGLKKSTTYEIVLERHDKKRIDEPVYIVYQKYGENITPAPVEVKEGDIGFSQVVFENDTRIKDIENNLKKSGKAYTVSDYSYKDNLSSTKSSIACDENGNISLFFDINAENLVDVTFKDSTTKKEVAKFGILASDVNSYSFTGFDKNKTYDVAVQGKTGNNWKIEGQYIIF